MKNGHSTLTVPGRVAEVSSPTNVSQEKVVGTYEEAIAITVAQANELFNHRVSPKMSGQQ
jgi:hypothetical protein